MTPSGAEAVPPAAGAGARVVLCTFGSLGDLHPYLAIAHGLAARGHRPAIATSAYWRERIAAEGVEFLPVRPALEHVFDADAGLARRVMDERRGSETVVRELMLPRFEETWEDTLAAARGADVLVSHPLSFAVPMLAELHRVPWVSTVLAPLSFFSIHDPPVMPGAGWLESLRFLGAPLHGPLRSLAESITRPWVRPVDELRARLGLPRGGHPLYAGAHSPAGALGLYSRVLGPPMPDWPVAARVTGFPYLDHPGEALAPELAAFLEAGEPPIVFTLGSSAVHDPGSFFEVALEVARTLGRRAVLLVGRGTGWRAASPLPASVLAAEYAPYAALFPRAAALVVSGGIGTIAEALRAGRPMLVLPYSHDQFDNAARVDRLGVARRITRAGFTATRVRAELARLLGEPRFAQRAAAIGSQVRGEDGVAAACEAIERARG